MTAMASMSTSERLRKLLPTPEQAGRPTSGRIAANARVATTATTTTGVVPVAESATRPNQPPVELKQDHTQLLGMATVFPEGVLKVLGAYIRPHGNLRKELDHIISVAWRAFHTKTILWQTPGGLVPSCAMELDSCAEAVNNRPTETYAKSPPPGSTP